MEPWDLPRTPETGFERQTSSGSRLRVSTPEPAAETEPGEETKALHRALRAGSRGASGRPDLDERGDATLPHDLPTPGRARLRTLFLRWFPGDGEAAQSLCESFEAVSGSFQRLKEAANRATSPLAAQARCSTSACGGRRSPSPGRGRCSPSPGRHSPSPSGHAAGARAAAESQEAQAAEAPEAPEAPEACAAEARAAAAEAALVRSVLDLRTCFCTIVALKRASASAGPPPRGALDVASAGEAAQAEELLCGAALGQLGGPWLERLLGAGDEPQFLGGKPQVAGPAAPSVRAARSPSPGSSAPSPVAGRPSGQPEAGDRRLGWQLVPASPRGPGARPHISLLRGAPLACGPVRRLSTRPATPIQIGGAGSIEAVMRSREERPYVTRLDGPPSPHSREAGGAASPSCWARRDRAGVMPPPPKDAPLRPASAFAAHLRRSA